MSQGPNRAADGDAARPYAGRQVALLTRHEKELALEPIFRQGPGAGITVIHDFDTDTLGTFTRDVPREGTQLEAARRKAQIAIDRSRLRLGLGSEGSFAPDPWGLMPWNLEIVVMIDADLGIEVVGQAHGPGLHVHGEVTTIEELRALAARAEFPTHGLVVRPDGPDAPRVRKGLRAWADLTAAFAAARDESAGGTVFVENDLRAHMHPSRMQVIARAGQDLVERLGCACPACRAPGFGLAEVVSGLPCGWCGTPTDVPKADLFACVRCDHREQRARRGADSADPGRCPRCNP